MLGSLSFIREIPLFDSLRVFVVRIMRGRHPLYPGREHIHHALLDIGFGHKFTSLILYFSCVFWTLAYDTIYALQDKIDDEKFGIKSLAIYMGKNNKYWIIFFYLCFISGIFYLGMIINLNLIFFFLIILFTSKIIFEIIKLDLHQPKNCARNFQLNSWYGFFITISLYLNYI